MFFCNIPLSGEGNSVRPKPQIPFSVACLRVPTVTRHLASQNQIEGIAQRISISNIRSGEEEIGTIGGIPLEADGGKKKIVVESRRIHRSEKPLESLASFPPRSCEGKVVERISGYLLEISRHGRIEEEHPIERIGLSFAEKQREVDGMKVVFVENRCIGKIKIRGLVTKTGSKRPALGLVVKDRAHQGPLLKPTSVVVPSIFRSGVLE